MVSTDCNHLSVCLFPPPNTHLRKTSLGCRDQFYAFGTIPGNCKSFTHQRTRRDFRRLSYPYPIIKPSKSSHKYEQGNDPISEGFPRTTLKNLHKCNRYPCNGGQTQH